MIFEWDDNKARSNFRRHKISFDVARLVFRDPNCVELVDKGNYTSTEPRYNIIGFVNQLLFVVYTERINKNGKEVIRIISARKATAIEEDIYVSNLH